MSTAWIYLILAGLFEVGFTTSMRFIDGFSRPVPILAFVVFSAASFVLLIKASASIPLGTAYAVWTGIGAAGTALLGILYFREPAETVRLLLLLVLVAAIIGLKLTSPAEAS